MTVPIHSPETDSMAKKKTAETMAAESAPPPETGQPPHPAVMGAVNLSAIDTSAAEAVREVIRELMREPGKGPGAVDYGTVLARCEHYWPGSDWRSASAKNTIYKGIRDAKPKRGRKPAAAKTDTDAGTARRPGRRRAVAPAASPPAASAPVVPDVAGAVEKLQELGSVLGWGQVERLVLALRKG